MLNGQPPYFNEIPFKVIFSIISNGRPKIDKNLNDKMSDEFKKFMDRCLEEEPQNRADSNELINMDFIKNSKCVDVLKPLIDLILTEIC
jgi:serine/threonine protein kinase